MVYSPYVRFRLHFMGFCSQVALRVLQRYIASLRPACFRELGASFDSHSMQTTKFCRNSGSRSLHTKAKSVTAIVCLTNRTSVRANQLANSILHRAFCSLYPCIAGYSSMPYCEECSLYAAVSWYLAEEVHVVIRVLVALQPFFDGGINRHVGIFESRKER